MDLAQVATESEHDLSKKSTEMQNAEVENNSNEFHSPGTIPLDPRGDLKLSNGNFLFLVSSHILMLSSKYFEKMLQNDMFAERLAQPQVEEPPIKILADEDPVAFGTMCKLLHYHEVLPPGNVKELGAIADVCDYYGTERAIAVHIRAWIHPFEQPQCPLDIKELQKLLWVAYTFRLEQSFEIFSIRLATVLSMESVKALDLGPLPDTVQVKMCQLHRDIQRHIRRQVDSTINDLRQNKTKHTCTKYLLCDGCSQRKPMETKKCGTCGSRDLSEELSQQSSRLIWFFDWLEAFYLWPTSILEDVSCERLIHRMNTSTLPSLLQSPWAHSCKAEKHCPYEVARKTVKEAVQKASHNVKGLQLHDHHVSSD